MDDNYFRGIIRRVIYSFLYHKFLQLSSFLALIFSILLNCQIYLSKVVVAYEIPLIRICWCDTIVLVFLRVFALTNLCIEKLECLTFSVLKILLRRYSKIRFD